jgi:hypothetical protein
MTSPRPTREHIDADATAVRCPVSMGRRSYVLSCVGSSGLTLHALVLMGLPLGCHALRHLVGGHVPGYSHVPCRQQRHNLQWVTRCNAHHME